MSGDAGRLPDTEAWYARLRLRFLALARTRVPEAAIEDVVQDALRIVHERGAVSIDLVDGLPRLAWCFQVLRNVIGNFYRKRRTRARLEMTVQDAVSANPDPTPAESLEAGDAARLVRECLDELERQNAPCGSYLSRLGEGTSVGVLAQAEGVDAAILSRRVYRCRALLRKLLEKRGIRL